MNPFRLIPFRLVLLALVHYCDKKIFEIELKQMRFEITQKRFKSNA